MSNYSEKIAILTGDPNGIGAEITIKALNLMNLPTKEIVIISNQKNVREMITWGGMIFLILLQMKKYLNI